MIRSGALNTLFGAFDVSAVLWTIWQQKQAINDQQRELQEQRFDSSFVQLLSYPRETRAELHYRNIHGIETKGRIAIRNATIDAIDLVIERNNHDMTYLNNRSAVGDMYRNAVHSGADEFLGPYFRILFNILRHIHDDKFISEPSKIEYGNIVRAQLGDSEISLLALNELMTESGCLTFYIEHFRMLRYMPEGPMKNLAQRFYGKEAFESRND